MNVPPGCGVLRRRGGSSAESTSQGTRRPGWNVGHLGVEQWWDGVGCAVPPLARGLGRFVPRRSAETGERRADRGKDRAVPGEWWRNVFLVIWCWFIDDSAKPVTFALLTTSRISGTKRFRKSWKICFEKSTKCSDVWTLHSLGVDSKLCDILEFVWVPVSVLMSIIKLHHYDVMPFSTVCYINAQNSTHTLFPIDVTFQIRFMFCRIPLPSYINT